jgi:predicted amidohydrolase YtcJ
VHVTLTTFKVLIVAFGSVVILRGSAAGAEEPADLVFRGGRIYTVDAQRSWASAVAIRDGRIRVVGNDADVADLVGANTRVIDLDGRMLLPGFHDSHVHLMDGGIWSQRCQLGGLAWPEQVLGALRICVAQLGAGAWLYGIGIAPTAFADRGPARELLDEITGERPALVRDRSGDLVWANSRALLLAGISADTPNPRYGQIERNPDTGSPTGTLRGEAASPVYRQLPEPDIAHYLEGLDRAGARANRLGITAIIEASISPRMLEAYVEAERNDTLRLRVLATQRLNPAQGVAQLDEIFQRASELDDERLSARAAKLFLDGGITQGTAALIEPYVGTPTNRGRLNWEPAALAAVVTRLDAAGFQVHMHAIGDRAIRAGLDALATAASLNGPIGRRHQIAHLELPDPADIARLARQGVTADIQALWAQPDEDTRNAIPMLGQRRAVRLLPFASLFAAGARVVGGSDWPSESLNPLYAIQIAMTRQPIDGSAPTWIPEQRVTLADMLAAYTIDGAWIAGQEQVTGSIEPGKAADLIVLERDLFAVEPMELHKVRVLLTLLDGSAVYCADGFPCP